jgi:malate dehydrogenase (quinone)
MEGREADQEMAATKMDLGTDVNFGSLTRAMFKKLVYMPGIFMHFNQDVRDISRNDDNTWSVKLKDLESNTRKNISAKFIFIGAGGGSLPLLLKSGIPEAKGYGGFPVSGQWLKCINPEIIGRHHAKVYGKASVGAPPMSVPHLDTRMIDNKKALLFGPYAGFSTRFLKNGSLLDLPLSVKASNILPMLSAGMHNLPLTKYLVQQVRQSPEDRLDALKEYFPNARMEDWELEIAGQRVQVIKKDEEEGGILEFGTEVVNSEDGSIAALLGASPGASTAVSIMVGLIQRCFPEEAASPEWKEKFREMIPSFGNSLATDEKKLKETREYTHSILGLDGVKECV